MAIQDAGVALYCQIQAGNMYVCTSCWTRYVAAEGPETGLVGGKPSEQTKRSSVGNSQRIGSTSNSQVGSDFEAQARAFFLTQGITLEEHVSLDIGVEGKKKRHKFDLGSADPKIILECKSHTWTEGENTPSAKMTTWTEAMYYFHVAPRDYRKVFFVLKAFSTTHRETLASYYLRTYEHLIPADVEFWEYDPEKEAAQRLR